MGSVRQIAKIVGVSPATVSRALNNPTRVAPDVRRRVLLAVNRSRYVPRLNSQTLTYVALAYTGQASLTSPFDIGLIQGMSERMNERGVDLVVLELPRARMNGESYSQMFLRKGVRGAVLRTDAHTRDVCEQIVKEGFPAVVVGDRFDNPKMSFVHSDSRAASREAVEHLISLGHRRIAVGVNVVDDSDHEDRLEGYRAALNDHGIALDEKLILRIPAERDSGRQLLRRVMTMTSRPTALFLTDPVTVLGAMLEARKTGVEIPRDLSIVGFDDGELRYSVYPETTAVCQDAAAMGREAFDALHAALNPSSASAASIVPFRKTLRTWLEVHGSTGVSSDSV